MLFPELVLASHNAGKLKELQAMLGANVRLRSVGEFSQVEPEETGLSFVENAILKARNAARLSGLPALADDSGICAPALGGAPGVLSARFAAVDGQPRSDDANNRLLVERLREHDDKRACYYAALVLVRHADDPQPLIGEGAWWGEVIDTPRGEGGFGYDPYFLLPALGKTAAELGAEKNRISHRAQALAALLPKLDTL